jgi:hypothetical protein
VRPTAVVSLAPAVLATSVDLWRQVGRR